MVGDRWYIDLHQTVRPRAPPTAVPPPATSLYTQLYTTLCSGHTSYPGTQIQGILDRNTPKSTEIHLPSFPPASLNQIGWCGADCLVHLPTRRGYPPAITPGIAPFVGCRSRGYLRQHALMIWCRDGGMKALRAHPSP